MTVMAMMQILFRMSLQGSIIIGIVLLLRMVFRGLRISYRYCVLLWGIAFFISYFPGRSRMRMDSGGRSRSQW